MTEQKIKGAGCEGVGFFSTYHCTFQEIFCSLEVVRVKCARKSEEARMIKSYALTLCTALVQRRNKRSSLGSEFESVIVSIASSSEN